MLPPTFSRYAPCRRVPAKHLDTLTPLSASAIPSVGWAVLLCRGTVWTHSLYLLISHLLIRTFVYSITSVLAEKHFNGKPTHNTTHHHYTKKQLENSIAMKIFSEISTHTPSQIAFVTSHDGSRLWVTQKNIACGSLMFFSHQILLPLKTNLKRDFYATSNSQTQKFVSTNSRHVSTSKLYTDLV